MGAAPGLAATLDALGWLVALDTRNPPRRHVGLVEKVREALGASFGIDVEDLGDGCVVIFATRGAPRLLVNAHLDTVPLNPAWERDPFALSIEGDRAFGLGACDIKGAAAAMIAAARATEGDAAILFTTDEEAGSSRCVRSFLERRLTFDGVLVAEPTGVRAVVEHRGVGTATAVFKGTPGHSSQPGALVASAVHEAVRWTSRALDHAARAEAEGGALAGLRFNAGRIEGGEKPNMVAASASVRFGVRPQPQRLPRDVIDELFALAPDPSRIERVAGFLGDPLPARGFTAAAATDLARALDLTLGAPVDFWTEGALFSAAGYPTIVIGPGDIARAHAADEWVSLADLEAAFEVYARLFRRSGS